MTEWERTNKAHAVTRWMRVDFGSTKTPPVPIRGFLLAAQGGSESILITIGAVSEHTYASDAVQYWCSALRPDRGDRVFGAPTTHNQLTEYESVANARPFATPTSDTVWFPSVVFAVAVIWLHRSTGAKQYTLQSFTPIFSDTKPSTPHS